MANASAYDQAASLAKANPNLHTGCHVVLIDGQPITSGAQTLINGSQRFRSSLKEFARAAVSNKMSPAEIQKEAEAQIGRIQSAGITVTHVDSHKHTHMFPHVLRPVLKAAKSLGVTAVRNPFEPLRAWPVASTLGAPGMWLRCAGVMSFQLFARDFIQQCEKKACTPRMARLALRQQACSTRRHFRRFSLRCLRDVGTGLPSRIF